MLVGSSSREWRAVRCITPHVAESLDGMNSSLTNPQTPVQLPDDSEVDVTIWREASERKVWYEWSVEAFTKGSGGQRFRIGVTELHSSKKNGCLM